MIIPTHIVFCATLFFRMIPLLGGERRVPWLI